MTRGGTGIFRAGDRPDHRHTTGSRLTNGRDPSCVDPADDHQRMSQTGGRLADQAEADLSSVRLGGGGIDRPQRDIINRRGIRLEGARGRARLLSPLVAGSLERASSLAEAMEARGFGRPGATRAPRSPWTQLDRAALVLAAALVAAGTLWL